MLKQMAGIKYYPLTKEGERFPVYDPKMKPVMTPVPESRRDFLHGILHGIAEVRLTRWFESRQIH